MEVSETTIKVSAIARLYARAVINGTRAFDLIKPELQPEVKVALADLNYGTDGKPLDASEGE